MTARAHHPDPLQPRIDALAEYARTLPIGEIGPHDKLSVIDIADEMRVEDNGEMVDKLIRLGLDPTSSDAELGARFRRLIYMPLRRMAADDEQREYDNARDEEMGYFEGEAA